MSAPHISATEGDFTPDALLAGDPRGVGRAHRLGHDRASRPTGRSQADGYGLLASGPPTVWVPEASV